MIKSLEIHSKSDFNLNKYYGILNKDLYKCAPTLLDNTESVC